MAANPKSPISNLRFQISNLKSEIPNPCRRGFTLVELLVVITILAMLSALSFGALQKTRQAAREAKTKETIAKLHNILMRKYESYLTRRVPVNTSGLSPQEAAQVRLDAIRDLMRMEMPDCWNDIIDPPRTFPKWKKVTPKKIQPPALHQLYKSMYTGNTPNRGPTCHERAELLYLVVMTGNPEAREQFSSDEIGDVDADGWPEFLDGWGKPIHYLRWAPGATAYSDIQVDPGANVNLQDKYHDPFDPLNVTGDTTPNSYPKSAKPGGDYALYPLVYSGAGIDLQGDATNLSPINESRNPGVWSTPLQFKGFVFDGDPNGYSGLGVLNSAMPIHNHHIEQK